MIDLQWTDLSCMKLQVVQIVWETGTDYGFTNLPKRLIVLNVRDTG